MSASNDLALVDYLRVLRRRSWVIVVVVAAAVAVAYFYVDSRPAEYEANATVLVRSGVSANFFAQTPGNNGSLFRNVSAEATFAGSADLRRLAGVIPAATSSSVREDAATSTLVFTVAAGDEQTAISAATSWAAAYVTERQNQDISSARQSIATSESALVLLRADEEAILAPIAPLDAALARSDLEPDEVTRLTTQRLSALQQLSDELNPITFQIQSLGSQLAGQELLIRFLEDDPEIAARVLSTPSSASDTRPPLDLSLISAAMLGFLLAVPLALLVDGFAGKVASVSDIQRRLPSVDVLGTLPRSRHMRRAKRIDIGAVQADARYFEAIQGVITSLQLIGSETPISSVLVTSAEKGAGKSTLSASVLTVLADGQHWLAAVDADLRRPRLGPLLGATSAVAGLGDVVARGVDYADAMVPALSANGIASKSNLLVLTAGTRTTDPLTLLRSPATDDFLRKLQDEADLTLIDTAPIMAVSDALLLVRSVSFAIVVVRAGKSRIADVIESVERLQNAGARVGVVVVSHRKQGSRYGYGDYKNDAQS